MLSDLTAAEPREVIRPLLEAGEELAEDLADAILARGREAIPALIEILEDDELAQLDAPGDGHAPIHAAALLRDLKATEAIEPMLRLMDRCDPLDILLSALLDALKSFGAAALEPALAAYHATPGERRDRFGELLSELGVQDERVFEALVDLLRHHLALAAGSLAEYGDARAVPHLAAVLDARDVSAKDDPHANHEIVELASAIKDLGGTLSPDQRVKLLRAKAEGDGFEAPLRDAFEFDEPIDLNRGDDDQEARIELVRSFVRSPRARSAPKNAGHWVELVLRYGWVFEGKSARAFGPAALRAVLAAHLPRKVSVPSRDAPTIVQSLRAFFEYARDERQLAGAEDCLALVGEDATERLSAALADQDQWGTAKRFFMKQIYSRALFPRADAGSGSSLDREEQKRRKKERKAKKAAQRRNRR